MSDTISDWALAIYYTTLLIMFSSVRMKNNRWNFQLPLRTSPNEIIVGRLHAPRLSCHSISKTAAHSQRSWPKTAMVRARYVWSTNLENFTLIAAILGEAGRWTIRPLDGSAYLNNGGLLSRTKAELCFSPGRGGRWSPPGKTTATISLLMDSFSGSCRLKIDRLQLN